MKKNGHRLRNTVVCLLVLAAILATGAVAGGENGVVEDLIYPIFGGRGSIQISNVGPSAVGFTAGSDEEAQEMSDSLERARQAGWTPGKIGEVQGPSIRDCTDLPEDGAALYYGKQHLDTHYTGREDYNDSFSCDPADGNRLNIWVLNTGETSLYVNVEWTTLFGVVVKKYPAVPLAPGEQYSKQFYYDLNTGIDGDWNINVTTQLGGEIDIDVAARQYQVNP